MQNEHNNTTVSLAAFLAASTYRLFLLTLVPLQQLQARPAKLVEQTLQADQLCLGVLMAINLRLRKPSTPPKFSLNQVKAQHLRLSKPSNPIPLHHLCPAAPAHHPLPAVL
jgi:hypothetical protein